MKKNVLSEQKEGYYGSFGGRFVPPVLEPLLDELSQAFFHSRNDPAFLGEFHHYLQHYVGRPSPLYFARRLTETAGGARIYLKREDLNHTGSHKINNTLGQALLARSMGKKRIVAETGAGQHGVATATACSLFDMDCIIYMGEEDIQRQELNVYRMELLGAEVRPVTTGTRTLKDAVDAALNDYIQESQETFYMLGSAVGPHPYPAMVRFFQSVIGQEAREQFLAQEGHLPDYLIACVGGGSNAIGLFAPFLEDDGVQIIGVEAGGEGLDSKAHAATMTLGQAGIIHGFQSIVLLDEEKNPLPVHSIAAGLDYPGIGPEHAHLQESGRATYEAITDEEALHAFTVLGRKEGIIPALESAHAIAHALKLAPTLSREKSILINLSGRGDKDAHRCKELKGN